MEQINFSEDKKTTKLETISREELIKNYQIIESENLRLIRENYELRNLQITDEQLRLVTAEQLASLKAVLYGASSEKYKKPPKSEEKKKTPPEPRIKKPSERYPNIPVVEVNLIINPVPNCEACGKQMSDSGMTEDSEQLTVIPKKYEITRFKRSIYRCSCQSCMKTAPALPRIIEGSTYSNEMIIDVVSSKYCDLIPMERYVQMAARGGLINLPPHSLIDLTHKFAGFVKEVYRMIKTEVLSSRVLHGDETPHRMLEGSDKKSWYLWGFSTPRLCFLECHSTRSGDVASEILITSSCEVLVTDVYSGYGKSVREVNLHRSKNKKVLLQSANCNAHARRYFFKPLPNYPESEFYLDNYQKIYHLESQTKGKPVNEILELRSQMQEYFEQMRDKARETLDLYPIKNQFGKALNYFLENYEGLTLFLTDADIPIDNNHQERLLRSHVVGRKTWYGTHSEQGAETAAILFSIVETCKLNDVNPREYFKKLVQDILARKPAYTPVEFKNQVV